MHMVRSRPVSSYPALAALHLVGGVSLQMLVGLSAGGLVLLQGLTTGYAMCSWHAFCAQHIGFCG